MVSFPVDKDPKENAKSTLQSDPREVLLVMTKYLSGNHVLGHGESTGRDPSETLPRGSLQASAAKAHRGRRAGAFLALPTRASHVPRSDSKPKGHHNRKVNDNRDKSGVGFNKKKVGSCFKPRKEGWCHSTMDVRLVLS